MLRDLWKKGQTAREIAAQIDPTISRNAIIGKANRLGLSVQQRPSVVDPYESRPVPTDFECQWSFGHVEEEDFYFCTKPVTEGKPYCAEHSRLAFRRQGDGSD